ncbi:MAG: hypothetical protein ACJAZ9_000424 [Neolewinella sp.]|jgi:hypothetical protein
MTSNDLQQQLRSGITGDSTFDELHALIVGFSKAGGSQDQAQDVLLDIGEEFEEEEDVEELLLELMDCVAGWGDEAFKIW